MRPWPKSSRKVVFWCIYCLHVMECVPVVDTTRVVRGGVLLTVSYISYTNTRQ